MELWHFVWLLAALTGLAAAGLVGSGWATVTGERLGLAMLASYRVTTPLRALVLLIHAPLALVRAGLWYLGYNPIFAFLLLGAGVFWSFLQGVFILTTFFGFT